MASLKDLIVMGPARFLDKLYGNLEGNAATATKLQTPRAINGTNFDGSTAITTTNWGTARNIYIQDSDGSNTGTAVSVNGGANATLKLPATIKATLSGNADSAYRLKSSVILTTNSSNTNVFWNPFTWEINSAWSGCTGIYTLSDHESDFNGIFRVKFRNGNGVTALGSKSVIWLSASTPTPPVLTLTTTINSESITYKLYISSGTGTYKTYIISKIVEEGVVPTTATAYTTSMTGTVQSTAEVVYASTATKLATARTINGTSFDGSSNITTANWGTARTLTIGSTGKSVNGSTNYSWTHAEIGATVSNTWTGGTTAGPTLSTTVNGVTGTAVAIPSASTSASGIVTTGEQSFTGIKKFASTIYANNGLYVGSNANGDNNFIAFYGTTGDGPGSYNHTAIGENFYGGTEGSELVLFKGNDVDNNGGGSPGPDRIRHIAARHLFQTYDSALSGSWTTICDSTVPVTRLEIKPNLIRAYTTTSIGTDTASYALNAASFICDSWIRTKGETGWYNETYSGGWYMNDSTWVRAYNNKKVYVANTESTSIKTEGGIAATSIETSAGYPIFRLADDISMSSLGTSATIEEYIKLYIKSICSKYPGKHGVFRGKCSPNSVAYVEVYIYDTSTVNSTTGLPQYCFGTWRQYSNTFYKFWTADYIFGLAAIVDSSNFSSILDSYYDSRYLKLSGGTMTGALNLKNGTWNKAGDDSQFGDNNTAGSFAIQGLNGATNLKMVKHGDANNYGTITWDGTDFTFSSNIVLAANKQLYMKYNNTNYSVVHSHNNGNVSLRACGGGLYIAYENTTGAHFGPSGNWGTINASGYSGNAASATKLATARTIFGRSFNGTSNVEGQVDCYGSYTATANQRYNYCALEIRENGLVGNTQSDIGYAPSIGFHWGSRIAATLNFHSDGIFYFRKQDGVTRATIDANVNGWASSAGSATTASYLVEDESFNLSRHSFQYFNISGTAGAAVSTNDTPTTAWWHIQRHTHANSAGYYTDVAIPFNDNQIYYKRVANGTLQNGGWVMLYDTKSIIYSSTEPTSGLKAGMIWLKPV